MFHRKMTLAAAILGLAAMLFASLPANLKAADDPLMGKWKLNVAKSRYDTGKPPKSYTRTHEAVPGGMKVVRDEVTATGEVAHPFWTAQFDGKDYPLVGEPGAFVDSLYLTRVDLYTVVGGSKKNGVLINTLRWEISKDGKTFTWIATRVNPPELKGTKVIQVFERQ